MVSMGTTRDKRWMIERQISMMDDGEYGDNKRQTRDKESMRRGWLICFMIIDLRLEENFLFILVFISFFFFKCWLN
jgi:hypothetical protein